MIVGQPNPEAYRELCRRYADDNVLFLEALPQEQLASVFAAAKVHALVSWFEVPGLTSLEAGLAGCNPVSTDRGSAQEYLQDMAWYCDPKDVDSIRRAVLAAHAAPRSARLRPYILEHYRWEQAAAQTLEGYRLALSLQADQSEAERGRRAYGGAAPARGVAGAAGGGPAVRDPVPPAVGGAVAGEHGAAPSAPGAARE